MTTSLLNNAAETVTPDLTGRVARCTYFKTCGHEAPSSPTLWFFKFRGEGSHDATDTCAICRYDVRAHVTNIAPGATVPSPRFNVVERGLCSGFVPHGPFEHDEYYCACRGAE